MRSHVCLLAVIVAAAASERARAATDIDAKPTPVAVKEITATSTYADAKDAYNPWHVFNPTLPKGPGGARQYNYAWCEGKPDEGVGEGITITFARPTEVAKVRIAAGVWKNQKLYDGNNHPSELTVTTDDNRKVVQAAAEKREQYTEVLLGGAAVNSISVTISQVKKAQMNDSCISEIQLWSDDGPLAPVVGVSPQALAALPTFVAEVSEALDKKDADTLKERVDFPFTYKGTDWFYEHTDEKGAARTYSDSAKLATGGLKGRPAPDLEDPSVYGDGPGQVVVPFGSRELQPKWRFVWRQNAWHLRAIDY